MLIKVIVALVIAVMLGFPVTGNIGKLKNKVNDDQLESSLTIIDSRLVDYYSTHSGFLPSSDVTRELSDSIKEDLRITDMDTSAFSYVKLDKDRFILYFVSSKGKVVYSLNSSPAETSKALTTIEPETF